MESTALLEKAEKMNNAQDTIGYDNATLIVTVVLIFTLYSSIRGLIQLFQRHNPILVIFYLVFLFPIAFCHMLLIGIFGQSKAARVQHEIEQEADKQIKIEAIKAGRK